MIFQVFSNELHNHIKWKQENRDSKMFADILSACLDITGKTFEDRKAFFISFCKNFQFEFLLLYEFSQDETILYILFS